MKPPITALERLAIAVASLALSVGLIAVLSGFFASRDQANVGSVRFGPGLAFRDLGDVHLPPGELHPVYDSDPPTSGAHVPIPVRRDGAELSDDQLLEALALGDVVVMYGSRRPPAGLRALARAVAAPFTPALAADGQAVILASRAGVDGILGLAWAHMVSVATPADPQLREFLEFWLGRGTPGH